MKGPGARLGCQVRRFWRCPKCDKTQTTSGDVASVPCPDCSDGKTTSWLVMDDREERNPLGGRFPPVDLAE